MTKPYLKSIVRNGGKGRMGLGVELFRLDAVAPEELTAEEREIAEESKAEASESGTAVMRIYEDIGEDFWTGGGVTAKRFSEELDSFGLIKRLNIHINSLGGDVFTAQAIYSIICDLDAKKTSYIDGVAASAATLIACGADKVIARNNTNYMLHFPWAMAIGNADTLRKAAEDLDKVTIPIVSVYKDQVQGKIDEEKIRGLMEDETWLTAEEALEYGLVDEIRGKIKAIAQVSKTQIMCSGRLMDIGKYHYRNVPKYPAVSAKSQSPQSKAKLEATPKLKQEETKKMTKEEIDPQLLATIETDARTAERVRLSALDAMLCPGLEDIITKAKAEGKQPSDIAMECFTKTKGALDKATVANALARDAQPAASIKAGDAPPVRQQQETDPAKDMIIKAFQARKPAMANGNGNR
jgi:ATP-dependent Clp protease, protease subunit